MAELEGLVEEYADASGLDRRRMVLLEGEIIDKAWTMGLAAECNLSRDEPTRDAITKLDARLCDIKELSIRDRLHVFGRAPEDEAQTLLVEGIVAALDATVTSDRRRQIENAIRTSAGHETQALLAALDGRRVGPGPAGAPSRGRLDVLPTGRNLTSVDPRAIPTRTAATIGSRAADEVVRRYLQDHGEYSARACDRSLGLGLASKPAATIWRRHSLIWVHDRSGTCRPTASPASISCRSPNLTGRASM